MGEWGGFDLWLLYHIIGGVAAGPGWRNFALIENTNIQGFIVINAPNYGYMKR